MNKIETHSYKGFTQHAKNYMNPPATATCLYFQELTCYHSKDYPLKSHWLLLHCLIGISCSVGSKATTQLKVSNSQLRFKQRRAAAHGGWGCLLHVCINSDASKIILPSKLKLHRMGIFIVIVSTWFKIAACVEFIYGWSVYVTEFR